MTESSSNYVSLQCNTSIQSDKKKCCKCKCKILYAIYFIFLMLYINYDLIIINSIIQVSYEDEQEQCSGSNVWLYLLMSLLLNHSLLFINYKYDENITKRNSLLPNFAVLVYKLGFSIWGSIIFIDSNPCIEEKNILILYKTGSIQYMNDLTSFFIVVLLSINIWFKHDINAHEIEEQIIMLSGELGQYTNEKGETIHSVKI